MPDTFTIDHDLNYREYLRVIIYLVIRMKIMKKIFLLSFFGFLAIAIFILALYTAKNHDWSVIVFQVIITPVMPVLSLSVFLFFFSTLFYLFRPRLFRNITYRFTHWGMEKTGKGFEYSRPWRNFSEFRETKSFFLLYISPGNAHIIQKRMFKNTGEAEALKNFVRKQIEEKTGSDR